VSDDEELVRLEGRLVLHDAVFRNPECCTQLSLFDCYLIHEGSPSNWTVEKDSSRAAQPTWQHVRVNVWRSHYCLHCRHIDDHLELVGNHTARYAQTQLTDCGLFFNCWRKDNAGRESRNSDESPSVYFAQ
jgi:hypothetical protein